MTPSGSRSRHRRTQEGLLTGAADRPYSRLFFCTKSSVVRVGKSGTGEGFAIWRLAMFKMPLFDPISIAVMGFGILLLAALALVL